MEVLLIMLNQGELEELVVVVMVVKQIITEVHRLNLQVVQQILEEEEEEQVVKQVLLQWILELEVQV